MIRDATENDLLKMVELGEEFYNSTILKKYIPCDPDSLGMLILQCIEQPNGVALVIEESGVLIGGFIGMVVPVYWNINYKVAQQIAWFVTPSKRSFRSIMLLKRWEEIAKEKGASIVFSGAKKDERFKGMEHLFNRHGYDELENLHVKGIS